VLELFLFADFDLEAEGDLSRKEGQSCTVWTRSLPWRPLPAI